MKSKKKYLRLSALLLIMAMFLTACGGKNNQSENITDNNGTDAVQTPQDETKAADSNTKSDGYEKFSQLKIGMTESEVNAILGEPVNVDKAYYYYNITVNGQDLELSVWINTVSGLVTYIHGDFVKDIYRAEFADSATDLSAADDLESGEIATYDDCVNAFKTPGYLTTITEDDVKTYLWVTSDDGYLTVTFRADGSVKSYSGYC